ncbi:hypothetical protein [Cellulomonas sp. HZM]|uniref:hypothetical protein n=1 Tax=Cellulomonas sp. HZM TaxID=1454010 RepID=UPI00049314BB|nr:hypothetical protein [Cellulomonas sp. HZM]
MNRTAAGVGRVVVGILVGLVAATLGTIGHRSVQPWGLVLALVLVLAAGVAMRAWGAWTALGGYAIGVGAGVLVLSGTGPGGDTLVPSGQAISYWWLWGSVAMLALAALAPARLFDDDPGAASFGWPPEDVADDGLETAPDERA